MVKDFFRGAMQVHVLHHAAKGGVHGAWLAVELSRHGYQISPGTLYPLLHRMEEGGLLVSHEEVSEGRVRRVYEATDAGEGELVELRAAVAELADEVLGSRGRLSNRRDPGRPVVPRVGASPAGAGRRRGDRRR